MTRQIVTALIAGSALFAAAGEPVVLKNFTDSARCTLKKPDAAPCTDSPGPLPTGAKEFSVHPPSNPGGAVVEAAAFGLSADAADNVDALNRALEHCRETGAAKLAVAPGTYRMTADRPVRLERMRDFIFDGGGATFVWHKKREANFRLDGCERVVMRNFKMDWEWEKDPLASRRLRQSRRLPLLRI